MENNYELQIDGNIHEFKAYIIIHITFLASMVCMSWIYSWHLVMVAPCIFCYVVFLILRIIDWTYYGRKVIMNADGCTFVSFSKTRTYSWDSIYLFHTMNTTNQYYFDREIPGEGVILSVNPIKVPSNMRAMNYCKFTHPSTSVFIRFENLEMDRSYAKASQLYLTGFVAKKEDVLNCLQYKQ